MGQVLVAPVVQSRLSSQTRLGTSSLTRLEIQPAICIHHCYCNGLHWCCDRLVDCESLHVVENVVEQIFCNDQPIGY
jgi:hypothetical protein